MALHDLKTIYLDIKGQLKQVPILKRDAIHETPGLA